jgi:hypothetical protein
MNAGVVTAVSRALSHNLVKDNCDRARLLAGRGVAGDAHQGRTVKLAGRCGPRRTAPAPHRPLAPV